MSTDQNIQHAANLLREAAKSGVPCEPVRNIIGETNIRAAYQVQSINSVRRITQGSRLVGRKIGLTSKVVQKQLGVDEPDFGMLYDSMEIPNGGEISFRELMQPKVEAEIAFILGKDLTEAFSLESLSSAVDHVRASIEIVGSRIKNWNIRITDTIADNASASHFVLGPEQRRLDDINIEQCKMIMTVNEEIVSEGLGRDCMDSPLKALYWLADTMLTFGRPLLAGDVVLSGALGPMATVSAGDHVSAHFQELGVVSVQFGE